MGIGIEQILRADPPARAVRWVESSVGGRVIAMRALTGGVSHATHAVTVDGGDRSRVFILRRWARPGWHASDPEYTAIHEARTLAVLERVNAPAPRCISVDPGGDECDVPAVLETVVPGRRPSPDVYAEATFLDGLAVALVLVHAVPAERGHAASLAYSRYYEAEKLRVPTWAGDSDTWRRAIAIAAGPAPGAEPCFLHRDYHPGNTLWQDGKLKGIVDWDRASWGSAAIDVAHTRVNLVLDGHVASAQGFTDVYRHRSGRVLEDLAYWDVVDTLDTVAEITMDDAGASDRIARLEAHVSTAAQACRLN